MKKLISDRKPALWLLYSMVILALFSSCIVPAKMAVTTDSQKTDASVERVSQPGKYKGYSLAVYEGRAETSEYITMRDGTRVAALIIRPTRDGKQVNTPLPVIWTHNRYHRENIYQSQYILPLLKHGYVIVSVDVRGSGASFGRYPGLFSPEETNDAYDITEWLAAQPWSDGNIGMYGRSYMGITQFMATSKSPPHLKAIFPEMSEFDRYSFIYPGGVFHNDFFRQWGNKIKRVDSNGMPVDGDLDQALLQDALKEHAANQDVFEEYSHLPYRDSVSPTTGTRPYIDNNPADLLQEIRSSGIPVYNWGGWYDMFPRDAFLYYRNLSNPKKIVLGPWAHPELGMLDLSTELLRWFDYWLKGIDNGIMNEAPIYYYTMGNGKKSGWHSAWQWPLPDEKRTKYYFDGTPSGSLDSVNDGTLSLTFPPSSAGADEYQVDYSATSGRATRWAAGYDEMVKPYTQTMMFNDKKGLTYTTPPLTTEIEVTGHPVVHLWITSSAGDGDFFVYLEDVSEGKFSKYITEGTLRASHRAVSEPPFDNLGLPYHRSYEDDISHLPDHPVELVFDLLPTSYVFEAGHRIRVTITCADKDTALTPQLDTPPTVHLYREVDHASYIELPIIPNP